MTHLIDSSRRIHCEMVEISEILAHTGQAGCETHKAMEGGGELRQLGDINSVGDAQTKTSRHCTDDSNLRVHARIYVKDTQGGGDTSTRTHHTNRITKARGRLGREASDCGNAAQRGSDVASLRHFTCSVGQRSIVGSGEASSRNSEQVAMLWRVSGTLEHVQHALRDAEPSSNVDT